MKNKIISLYAMGFLMSWVAIAGMANAHLKAEFPNQNSHRERMQDLGFSIAWGALGSVMWPITLPGTFFAFGFACDGWSLTTK